MRISEELKSLIPPLTLDEYSQLEKNCLEEGIRDPLVVWGDVVVDGHNRYEIAQKHGLEFKTVEKEFGSIEAVKVWMIDNQKGRRNLTDGWKFELAQVRKEMLLKRGREKQKETLKQGDSPLVLSKNDKTEHNTREELAKELGWSTGKVAIADKVWSKAPKEVKEKIKAGEVSINEAYNEIRKQEKKEERQAEIEKQKLAIEQGVAVLPEGKFEVLVADPPWGYGADYDPEGRRVTSPYPEMNQEELLGIELPSADDCVLFLWTTHKFIWDAHELLEKWGFTYRSILIWDKEKMGIGDLFRMQCEFCLVGIKGKPVLDNNHTYRDIIKEPRREHSRKPEAFYELVERLCVGRRLDYFSREQREGWCTFGNDTNKF